MVQKGAKYIVLASRNAEDQEFKAFLETLNSTGTVAVARNCDITDELDFQKIIKDLERHMPPIRGVLNAAMVLQDALFENMTNEKWEAALAPKVIGSLNLHNHFQGPDLEFWIVLSSATGILGNMSQANYTAACTYQDALANYRASKGLPGVSINLGSVKSIGVVADQAKVAGHLTRVGFRAHDEDEVLHLVQAAIQCPRRKANSAQLLSGIAPFSRLDDILWRQEARFAGLWSCENTISFSQVHGNREIVSLKDALASATTLAEAIDLTTCALVTRLSGMFMIPESDVHIDMPLVDFGVDSLVAVELRNWIAQSARTEISIFDVTKSRSLGALAEIIVQQGWAGK
jgi:acyl carrier protein